MEPTPIQPSNGFPGSASPSTSSSHSDNTSSADTNFSTTAAHATGDNPYPSESSSAQPAAAGVQGKLNDALASGKKWLNDSGLADKAQQLPQTAKELGNKALSGVSGLTTTQKAVGLGLLAAGVAFLATRGKSSKDDDGDYRHKPRRSPFDHQPHTKDSGDAYDRKGQRPWGANRYAGSGAALGGKARISSGSGYSSSPSYGDFGGRTSSDRSTSVGGSSQGSGQRRDQGPSAGSSYDARTSGSQNPNNVDQLNSAF